MLHANHRDQGPGGPRRRRRIAGTRSNQACINCKDKKLKVMSSHNQTTVIKSHANIGGLQCDDLTPACGNCQRLSICEYVFFPERSLV